MGSVTLGPSPLARPCVGWDYSTRWLSDATGVDPLGTADLTTINANKVVAVDLNSILYDMEKTLASPVC